MSTTPSTTPMRLSIAGAVTPGGTLRAVLLIGHPMESGYRTLESGQRVPKNVIESIRVLLNGQLLLEAQTSIGISAHPYLAFPVPLPAQLDAGGLKLTVLWQDDSGARGELQRVLL